MMWKIAGIGLASIFIGGMVFGFWRAYSNLLEDNKNLSSSVGTLKTVAQAQDETIAAQNEKLQDFIDAQEGFAESLENLAKESRDARNETKRLLDVFSDSDFTRIVNESPDSAERLINRGTRRINSMLECASGSGAADCGGGDSGAQEPVPAVSGAN